MTKSEMIEKLAKDTGLAKADVEKVFNGTFNLFKSELAKGNNVPVAGFGTFKATKRAARNGINPLTKQPLHIPARNAVSFKAGSALKEAVNK